MSTPLVLIDASSYFFRAFHALPPLTNSKGQSTGAIYGVANMIKKLIKDYKPEKLAVIFDAKGPTFRDEWYPEYKAHRAPMPSELYSQFQPLIQLLKAMGLPLLIVEGVEADDVIGTLAKQATEHSLTTVVSTGDKDMAQLVNEHVSLINTMSNYTMDVLGVKQKFGVEPEQMIDYLTLIGDSVDNIPGVTKCGPKTAVKWLDEYKTLDNLIQNADQIGGKIGDYLRASLPQLPLSKKLITIKTDVELSISLDDLVLNQPDNQQLIELTSTLEFKTWLKELLEQKEGSSVSTGFSEADTENPSPVQEKANYEVITTLEQLNNWLNKLTQASEFCIVTHTSIVDLMQANLAGIALAVDRGVAAYIPLNHSDSGSQLACDEVLGALKPILERDSIGKIGRNMKQTCMVLRKYGIQLQGVTQDIMLESYILNSSAGHHDTPALALKYLGYKTKSLEEITGKGMKQLGFSQIPALTAGFYAAEDADFTLQIHHHLIPTMDDSLKKVFADIEMPLSLILSQMEELGVLIDPQVLALQGTRLKARIQALEQEALDLAGRPFNLNSPKQLQEILFDEQKIPVISKTPTGQPSTAESVLQELAYDYRLPAVILEYRGLTKLVTTYIDALPKKIDPTTHRVHTSYNQAVAATGRLSSSEPNLQNIPIRNEEGRLIRTAFVAPEGWIILAADYSQIELRIMAHLSQDENLLKAFANDWDIHTATASEIFQTPLLEVTHEQRRKSKAVNFGLIYGMSAFGLAKQIGVERQDAQHYIDTYFQRYPGVLEYMERTRKQAHEKGYVETLFGRRLYLPEINVRNIMRQKAAERMAINAPMQGTAADIIKKAMIAIASWQMSQENPCAKMIMQVHDELVFEVNKNAIEYATKFIMEHMEQTVQLSVPLRVSIGMGLNWEEAHG